MGRAGTTVVLVLSVMGWIGAFVLGIALDAGTYFQRVTAEEATLLQGAWAFVCLTTSWTWSNVLGLCCLSALVGEDGRDAMATRRSSPNPQAAIVRGFFIFLAMAAGQLVIAGNISLPQVVVEGAASAGDPLVTSPGQYFRLASFCSLLAFLVGFAPRIFHAFLNGLHRLTGVDGV